MYNPMIDSWYNNPDDPNYYYADPTDDNAKMGFQKGNDFYNAWLMFSGQGNANRMARETNETNERIANQNLELQKDWNEYQKALQQELFEREDTAYQRTAADMLAAGLNPLSMQGTNGSGQVVSTTAPQNNFQAQQGTTAISTLDGLMSGISSIIGQIEAIKTGRLQRDQLQEQVNYQRLINEALDRENKHKIDIGSYDTDMLPEKLLTHLLDWTKNGRFGKTLDFSVKDLFNLISNPESAFDKLPILKDIKDLINETNLSSTRLNNNTYSNPREGRSDRDVTTRYNAKVNSNNTKNFDKNYQKKNNEYTQRYGGK